MKKTNWTLLVFSLILLFSYSLHAQSNRPRYCDELPVTYSKGASQNKNKRSSLPRFNTKAVTQYKVQVAILRFTDPSNYPFHSSLIARHRPCEDIWVIESRDVFTNRKEANHLCSHLKNVGYTSAYIVEILGYQ